MSNVYERERIPMGFGSPDDQSDFDVKRLILLDEGATNPSAETIASISDAAVARYRERMASEVAAQQRAEYANSPEGRMERAEKLREERQAREAKAELARDFLVDTGQLARDEADELDTQEAIFAARFEEKEFSTTAMSVAEQDAWLRDHPNEAAQMERKAEVEHFLSAWHGRDHIERAHGAAHLGIKMQDAEAELERRGIQHSRSSDHVAAQTAYSQVVAEMKEES